jgi:hypothetical protein
MTPERRRIRRSKTVSKLRRRVTDSVENIELRSLTSIEEALEREDDLASISAHRRIFSESLKVDRLTLQQLSLSAEFGFPEELLRNVDFFREGGDLMIVPYVLNANANLASRYTANVLELLKHRIRYVDEDDVAFALEENPEVSFLDIYREKVRVKMENVALLQMQEDWLRERKRKERKRKKDEQRRKTRKVKEVVGETPEITEETKSREMDVRVESSEEDFSLKQWNVSWATRNFSDAPNHLVDISTSTREIAESQIEEVGRGQISIKPMSIVSALEFHLQKNVIQRALAARNKYGPEGIRDWVKIKRGRDRIFLLVNEEQNGLVFFAAGRDEVYQGI